MSTFKQPAKGEILKRLREFKRIGQTEFLRRYSKGVGAIRYYILFDETLCDMKAIWGAAHRPTRPSGSFNTSEPKLYLPLMGFTVVNRDQAKSYTEGQRRYRETSYFARNPALVADAKRIHGVKCVVCGFDFEKIYGSIGKGYIECHHLKQMADNELRATKVEDVAVLCANCHRMIHHGRKMLTIDQLQRACTKEAKAQRTSTRLDQEPAQPNL
jgi:hypothetical protein